MFDAISASIASNNVAVAGPLCGVVFGAGLTWLMQRNEWGRQRRWELRRELRGNAVIMTARDALGNRDAGELPLFDESN